MRFVVRQSGELIKDDLMCHVLHPDGRLVTVNGPSVYLNVVRFGVPMGLETNL